MITLNPTQSFPINLPTPTPLVSNWNYEIISPNISDTPTFLFVENAPITAFSFLKFYLPNNYLIWQLFQFSDIHISYEIEEDSLYPVPFEFSLHELSNGTMLSNSQCGNWYQLQLKNTLPLNIQAGAYHPKLKIKVKGTKNFQQQTITSLTIPINVHVFAENSFYSPQELTFYNGPESTNSQQFVAGGTEWQLVLPHGFNASGSGVSISNNADGQVVCNGNGLHSVQIAMQSNISQYTNSQAESTFYAHLTYQNTSYAIPIHVIETGVYYPQNLFFTISSGIINQDFQWVYVNTQEDLSIFNSGLLDVITIDTPVGKKLKVSVINPENIGNGIFNETIDIMIGNTTHVVNVQIQVMDTFDLGITTDTINFTQELPAISFSTETEGSFAKLNLKVSQHSKTFEYYFPFFEGTAKKGISEVTDRLLHFESTETEWQLPRMDLNVKEMKNNNILQQFQKQGIPIMKGRKPKMINNVGILQHNHFSISNRFSKPFVNVISKTGLINYEIRKNNQTVWSPPTAFGQIKRFQMNWEWLSAQENDIFDFVLHTNSEDLIKSFVISEPKETFDVYYYDSFGLLSVVPFTGPKQKVSSSITKSTTKKYSEEFPKGFLAQNFANSEKKIQLNTGFIMKSQLVEIEELLLSPKVYIYKNGKKICEAIAIEEKLELYDSEKFLYDYTVEFIITNPKYAHTITF